MTPARDWWDEPAPASPAEATAPKPAAAAEVDWLGVETAPKPSETIFPMPGEWSGSVAAPKPAPRKPRAPAPTLIPATDAWLLFRAVPAPGDPGGPCDHIEDLRVVSGSQLNERQRRSLAGEPRDWTHDVPLLRCLHGTAEEQAAQIHRLGGDPATDAAAAWRLWCAEWRFSDFGQVAEAVSVIQGLEWVETQWRRGQG